MPGGIYLQTKHSGVDIQPATRTIVEFYSSSIQKNPCLTNNCYSIPYTGRDLQYKFVSLMDVLVPENIDFPLYMYDSYLNPIAGPGIGDVTTGPNEFMGFSGYKHALIRIFLSAIPANVNWFIPGNAEYEVYGTPFRRICEEELCTTTFIAWGTCKDILGIKYSGLTNPSKQFDVANSYEQFIRFDAYIHSPEWKEESKIYRRSDGTTLKVNTRHTKTWNAETGYIPEHAREGLITIMNHDYAIWQGENGPQFINRRMILESTEIVKDNAPGLPTGNAKLKMTLTESVYNKYRSYCSNCIT